MSIFAYVQYINDAYIVGGWVGLKMSIKPAYVIFEWSLTKHTLKFKIMF